MRMIFASAWLTLALAIAPIGSAQAVEFKWSFQGDAQSLDPHGLSEVQTLGFQSNFYEPLVRRGKDLQLEPGLAESWTRVEPTIWRFNLRKNVVFHDGTPFKADDVIFSLRRTQAETSDAKAKIRSIKEIRKIDDHTIDMVTNGPSPLLLGELSDWFIMNKDWSERNNAATPADVRKGQENFATRNANGTGPFRVTSRQPDVRTEFEAFDKWWGKKEHNVTKATFLPITNAATRIAALLSGEVDMVYPVPTQDIPRIKASADTAALQEPETRVIFFGFDHKRDHLLYGDVKDKNPFKDIRVRKAVYQAIDVDTIVKRIMDGAAVARGTVLMPAMNGYVAELDKRLPYDPTAAKKLLTDAGYPNGFRVTLDCPNDRYVNDEAVCVATAAMLARIGIKVDVAAISKTKYFGKILGRDTSFYMLGWAAPTLDAHNPLYDLFSTPAPDGHGKWNMGDYSNAEVTRLTGLIANEVDEAKRNAMIKQALTIVTEEIAVVPLYQQTLAWGVRKGVSVAQRADDKFEIRWVRKGN
jgi:peptide/nickel transport system substrate-binding protein